jgi:hypothetical protein
MPRLLVFPFREDGVFDKDDVTLNSLKVAFFGAIGVIFSPNGIADDF